jgi:hypothetical protein
MVASSDLPPAEWTLSAPSTKITAGPPPILSYAIVVPSRELTVLIAISSGAAF